jgi:hypothetical protein
MPVDLVPALTGGDTKPRCHDQVLRVEGLKRLDAHASEIRLVMLDMFTIVADQIWIDLL